MTTRPKQISTIFRTAAFYKRITNLNQEIHFWSIFRWCPILTPPRIFLFCYLFYVLWYHHEAYGQWEQNLVNMVSQVMWLTKYVHKGPCCSWYGLNFLTKPKFHVRYFVYCKKSVLTSKMIKCNVIYNLIKNFAKIIAWRCVKIFSFC